MIRYFFPPEFDPAFYRKSKPYLVSLTDDILKKEFTEYGIKSGSPGSILCYREKVVQFIEKIGKSILEIGPGGHPAFRGNNVKYVDVFTTEELKKKYASPDDRPPNIDYSLDEFVNGSINEKFDVVYSAHNFEHQINPVRHIGNVANVLHSNGYFIAIIPDRNFTFDYFREKTTLADILAAPDSQTEHTLRSRLIKHIRTHNNCIEHWFGNHGEMEGTDEDVIAEYLVRDDKTFQSLHVNVFDPISFKQIFGLLSARNLLDLELIRVYNTPFLRNEFVTVFRKKEEVMDSNDCKKNKS